MTAKDTEELKCKIILEGFILEWAPPDISSVPRMMSRILIRVWQIWLWLYIIYVAERVFVEDVSTHLVWLETMKSECADTEINSIQSSNKWIHSKRVHSNDTGAMDMKKAKFQYEAAAMAGHEGARCNLGTMEAQSWNMGRAVKHWKIAASAGSFRALHLA